MGTLMSRSGAEFWLGKKLPPDIAYLYKDMYDEDFVPVTFKEISARKTARQEANLITKRATGSLKPAYIWVFYNDTWIMGGWYIYILTLKKDYAINFRHERNNQIILKAMELFPCGTIPIVENFDNWADAFSVRFPHFGFRRKKKQGLVKCMASINEYGQLEDLESIIKIKQSKVKE